MQKWKGWSVERWEVGGDAYVTVYAPTGDGCHLRIADLAWEPLAALQRLGSLRRAGDPSAIQVLMELAPETGSLILTNLLVG